MAETNGKINMYACKRGMYLLLGCKFFQSRSKGLASPQSIMTDLGIAC